jgi:hypothetical protein
MGVMEVLLGMVVLVVVPVVVAEQVAEEDRHQSRMSGEGRLQEHMMCLMGKRVLEALAHKVPLSRQQMPARFCVGCTFGVWRHTASR